jgi:transcriptional regulator with XRE-family HTH domain
MNIGSKIKTARIAKNLTQEELGKLLGVQKSAIAKYESGRVVNIKRSTLKKIAEVLEIRPSELIFAEEIKQNPIGTAERHIEIIMDEDINEIFDEFKTLSKKEKQIVKDLVRSLAKKEEV